MSNISTNHLDSFNMLPMKVEKVTQEDGQSAFKAFARIKGKEVGAATADSEERAIRAAQVNLRKELLTGKI